MIIFVNFANIMILKDLTLEVWLGDIKSPTHGKYIERYTKKITLI